MSDLELDARLDEATLGTGAAAGSFAPRLGRVRAVLLASLVIALAVGFVLLRNYQGGPQNLADRLKAPGTADHLLGTDELGRDVLLRLAAGLPWALTVGVVAVLFAAVVGTAVGVTAGWARGWLSTAVVRFTDFYVAFPFLVFALVLVSVIGRGTISLALILGAGVWPLIARVAYGETRRIKQNDYVIYATMLWPRSYQVILRHVLPALTRRVGTICAFLFGDVLGGASALSLLGVGSPLGTPTWGNMMAEGQLYLRSAPWIAGASGGAVVLLIVLVTLLIGRLR